MNNKSDNKNNNGNTKIKDLLKFKIKTTKLIKVITLLIFKRKLSKLKVYLAKVIIYIKYNMDIFENDLNKVIFAIFYLKGLVFDYIEIFFKDFKENVKKDWKF